MKCCIVFDDAQSHERSTTPEKVPDDCDLMAVVVLDSFEVGPHNQWRVKALVFLNQRTLATARRACADALRQAHKDAPDQTTKIIKCCVD
jgi:hypothetical protein